MNSKKILAFILLAFLSIGAFAQGTLCSSATPFCTAIGTPFTYQNVTGTAVGQAGPNYGCLLSQPRPSWFYIKSSAAGAMTFSLTQSTSPGGAPNIDVDFIAYGPYSAAGFATACSNLTGGCTADHNCAGNTEDCSYSPLPTETMTLNPTAAGQYFIIMITNFAGTAGFITFTQTGGPASDCSITCPNVTSGDGFTLPSGFPLPSVISCESNAITISASDNAPFGAPIVPGVMFNLTTTANATYSIDVYSASSGYLTTLGPLGANTNIDYQLYYMTPSETYSFSLCESNTASPNVPYSIMDLASGTTFTFGTWVDDGLCQTVVMPPGTMKGVSTFTASCGSCITSYPNGYGIFSPSTAGVGTHTITYTFAPGAPCAPYVFSKVITIVSPTVTSAISSATICEGASTTLTVSSGPTQTFSNTSSFVIPDGSATGVSSPITVTGIPGNAGSSLVSINVNITHAYDSDLGLYLVSPCGYTIALSQANGGAGANYTSTTFSTSGTSIYAGTPPFTGVFRPEDPLMTLSGCASNGVWKLFAKDNFTPDQGTITSWSMSFTDKNTYSWAPSTGLSATTGTNVVASPTTTTVYSVTASSNAGCVSAAKTITVTVNPKPTANAGSTNTLTCSNKTITLSGSGGGTYSWTGPGIVSGSATATPSVNVAGNYSLVVTSAAGCPSSISTVSISQNITPPTPTASNSTTLTCNTTSAILTGGGGGTYAWSGPSITAGGTTSSPTVNAPGNYSVTVTAANGCTAVATTSVSQNITPPTPTASNSTTLTCTTTSATLTGTGGGTYAWSGPGTITNGTNANPTINTPGTFTVLVTAANGCTATANTTVSQNTISPSVTMPATQTITCASPTVSMIGSANPSTCTPVWTGGACAGATTYTASACSPNTYTLTVTNPANGCTNSGTVSVVPSVGIPVVNASNSGSITCATTTAQVTASTTMTPVSYSWSGPGAVSGASTSTGTVTVGGTYQCIVTNTLTGCTSTVTTLVPTNTTAVLASIAPTSTITCTTTSLTLSASPTGSYSYSWTPTAGLSGTSVATPTITQGGVYSVTVTNTASGCVGNTNITVASNTVLPTVNIAAPSVTTTCSNPSVTIVASSTPSTGVTYSWTAPGTGSLSQNNIANPVASGSGIFTVVVTNTASGCSSSLTQNTVQVTPDLAIPVATLSANSLSITCSNPTVTANISTTSSPVSYSWSPTTGIVAGTETTANPVFNAAGTYSAVVTNTTSGCASNAASNIVTVSLNNTIPTIALTSSVNNGTITCTNTVVTISPTVTPTSNLTYTWLPSGVTSSTINDASFTAAGIYTLAVTNTVTGCVTSLTNTANTFTVIANNTPPTFTLGTAPSLTATCAAPSVTLSGSSNADPNSVYTWTTPSSSTINGNPISVSSPGIYTVAVTNTINGCSSSAASQNTVEVVADAGIPNVTLSSNSVSITCSNPTPSVAISTTSSPVSYSWTPTTGIVPGTETTANPVFNAAGSYSVVVTNTTTGCATGVASNIVNVSLDNTIPTITLSSAVNNGTITCTNTLVTISPTVTPSANLTYTWLPSGVTSSTINDATFTSAGVYTLAVTNTLTGCVTSLTNTANTFTVIADNATPSFTLGTANSVTTTCAAPNATLSASSDADPNAVYTWTTPSSSTIAANPLVSSAAGIYSVIVTNTVNGCSTSATSPATVEVVADAGIPVVTLSANSVSITCSNPTPSVAVTTTASPVSYSWSPTTGIVPGTETTANPVFNAAGSYSVVVTNTASGCATSILNNVVDVALDNAIPVITLSSGTNSGTITCTNTVVTIAPVVTPTANLTYTWSPSGVTSSSINDATFTAPGIYTLVVTNTLTGCVTSSTNTANTYTVTIDNAVISATINAISSNTIIGCGAGNSAVTLQGSSSATTPSYTWMPGGITTQTFAATTAGDYTLSVQDVNSGCSTSTVITVIGSTTPPQGVNAGTSANIACGSSTVTLNGVTTTTNTSFSWSGPSATSIVAGTETTANPIATEVGAYTLTVTDNLTGCSSTDVVNVTQAIATASIIANPTSGISPLDVAFTGAGAGNPNYSWNFGDGNTSNSQNPNNTFTTGTYTVTLTTTSGSCTATATVEIVVEDGLTIEIPNVFTPNNDGANDVFTIKSTGVKEIALQIFNRWGEKLYEFSGAKASWDGLAPNSAKVPEGTYFYFVKATGFDGTEIEKHGTVNLFR